MNIARPTSAPERRAVPVIPEHELLRPIASGGYGQVWLARNRLGTYRAVKIVQRGNFEHERPFEREFAGIKAFEPVSHSHEGLVNLLQVGRDDAAGYFYYVMELADNIQEERSDGVLERWSDGKTPATRPCSTPTQHSITPPLQDPAAYTPRTLAAEIKHRGRLPLEECIRVGLSLTQALAYLHRQGLVHRDVKPSNIIFVRGAPKLADVGLVTGLDEARSFVGTEGFIPPEGPGTPQADLYSLGILLYVMSTGKSHQDFPEPLPDLATQPDHARWLEFNAVIHKACQAEPRQRYQAADEMRDDLALLQQGRSVKRKRAVQQRWALASRLGLVALAIACLLLAWPFRRAYAPNSEAKKFYSDGQWFYSQLTPEDHVKALEALTQATKRDPKFVQPYAELTALYVWNSLPEITTDQLRLQRTRELATRAMAIDSNSAEAHTALSWCHFLERDWRGAEAEIVRAIQLNPKLTIPRDIHSFYLTILERFEEAHREAQQAENIESSEGSRATAIVGAFPFIGERRFDEAVGQLKRVVDRDPRFAWGHLYLGICYEAQSNYLAAIPEFKKSDLLFHPDSTAVEAAYTALRQAYDAQGQEGYFRKRVELILAEQSLPEEKRIFDETTLAGYYARLGENEKALEVLETHFDEPNVWHQIKFEPLYDSLRHEPRYEVLVKRARLAP